MRKMRYISGASVRLYTAEAGVVSEKQPWFLRTVLNLVVVTALMGAAAYGALMYLNASRQKVLQSNEEAPKTSQVVQTEEQPSELQPYQAKQDEELQELIEKKLKEMPKDAEFSVAVRDLNSPRMAMVNADEVMEAASLYKLFLLAPLEKRISADNWKSYAGGMSINDCVAEMIRVSNNDCPQGLGNYIGWKNINPHNQSLGFSNTSIGAKQGNVTTAREVNEMMYRLQNSMILSDKARRLVFDALYAQEYRSGIPAGCGSKCLVANKTGDIDGYKHDAAVVTHDNMRYVLVIMSKNASWSNIAKLAAGVDSVMASTTP